MTLKDLFNSTNYVINERIRNPFIITFIFVWIGRNKGLILAELFSDKKVASKAAHLNDYLSNYTIGELFITVLLTFLGLKHFLHNI